MKKFISSIKAFFKRSNNIASNLKDYNGFIIEDAFLDVSVDGVLHSYFELEFNNEKHFIKADFYDVEQERIISFYVDGYSEENNLVLKKKEVARFNLNSHYTIKNLAYSKPLNRLIKIDRL